MKKENNNKLNNNITDNSNDFDKDNIDKITSKKINTNFERIEIDANKNISKIILKFINSFF